MFTVLKKLSTKRVEEVKSICWQNIFLWDLQYKISFGNRKPDSIEWVYIIDFSALIEEGKVD